MHDLPGALSAWRACFGDAYVLDDPATLRAWNASTFASTPDAVAVLRPGDVATVRDCLTIAAAHGVAVHPVSRGRNWGLGSRAAAREGAVALDLSRMNAITGFDEAMAWIEVEPGVTFRQVHDFLTARGSRLFASVTGSSPDASVLANALERGDGAGPLGDRWAHVCALEAVLTTGEVLHTGFGRFEGVAATHVHRWGVGPSLDGLLSQSNLAVVTRMTLWLTPLPTSIQALRFSLRDPARLPALVDALRSLQLDGTLRAPVGLWNDLRVLSVETHAPSDACVDASTAAALRPGWEGARWFGLTGLYAASELQGRAFREHAVAHIAPLVDVWGLEERLGDPVAGRELLWETEPAFGYLQGVPHEGSLRSVYWRKSFAPERSLDPDRDRCGVLWVCAAVPWRGDDIARACGLVDEVLPAHGFEAMTAAVAVTPRVANLVPSLLYDRDDEGADARALACHDALTQRFNAAGYAPYRLGARSMAMVPTTTDDTLAVLARVKAAFDPSGVLAPGRYVR